MILIISGKCVAQREIAHHSKVSYIQLLNERYTCKNTPVVTNLQQTCSDALPTTCQHDVFALLVSSLLRTCYKVVELNRLVTSCSITTCHRPAIQQFGNKL
jgi:hypothetical protein